MWAGCLHMSAYTHTSSRTATLHSWPGAFLFHLPFKHWYMPLSETADRTRLLTGNFHVPFSWKNSNILQPYHAFHPKCFTNWAIWLTFSSLDNGGRQFDHSTTYSKILSNGEILARTPTYASKICYSATTEVVTAALKMALLNMWPIAGSAIERSLTYYHLKGTVHFFHAVHCGSKQHISQSKDSISSLVLSLSKLFSLFLQDPS